MFDEERDHGTRSSGAARPSRGAQSRAASADRRLRRLVAATMAPATMRSARRGRSSAPASASIDGVVGGAVDRRGRDAHDQPAVADAVDARSRRDAGSRARRCGRRRGRDGSTSFAHGAARGTRRPKIAVPTRTIVAPSSIATSKSWLMPIESSRQPVGRHAARDQAVADFAQPPEPRPRVFGLVGNRRHDHQAAQRQRARVERGLHEVARRRARRRRTWSPRARDRPARESSAACRLAAAACIELSSAGRGGRPTESRRTPPAALRALFDCRWPMRCQSRPRSRERVDLVERLPARGSRRSAAGRRPRPRARASGAERLGDGDERECLRDRGGRVAPPQ